MSPRAAGHVPADDPLPSWPREGEVTGLWPPPTGAVWTAEAVAGMVGQRFTYRPPEGPRPCEVTSAELDPSTGCARVRWRPAPTEEPAP